MLYFANDEITRSRGNIALPWTTVAGATPFTRTSGASSIASSRTRWLAAALLQHRADALAVLYVGRKPDRRAAVRDAAARHADADAVPVGDRFRGSLRAGLVPIDRCDVRAFP